VRLNRRSKLASSIDYFRPKDIDRDGEMEIIRPNNPIDNFVLEGF
jgi:hypothetical protein